MVKYVICARPWKYSQQNKMADMVGMWEVPLSDEIYQIEFEHGTTTGKRVIYINGKVS